MKKFIPVVIIALCALSIYSCKKDSNTPTTVITTDPADSFVGTWNTIDTSYYFGVKTDYRNFNFHIVKTAANKISLIGFPTGTDTTHATVTANSMVTDDTLIVVSVLNPRSWTYREDQTLFGPGNLYILGKATKQ